MLAEVRENLILFSVSLIDVRGNTCEKSNSNHMHHTQHMDRSYVPTE
jgi:hypothetical protein